MSSRHFGRSARARERLQELVDIWNTDGRAGEDDALHALAAAGHALYQAIFPQGSEDVAEWLRDASGRDEIESLELVVSAHSAHPVPNSVSVPWNVVYCVDPAGLRFGPPYGECEALRHFWGTAYNLAAGLRVDPLRRRYRISEPQLLFVVDPATEAQMAGTHPEERQRLQDFITEHGGVLAQSTAEVAERLRQREFHLLYWFSHATQERLSLGADELTAHDLYTLLHSANSKLRSGIAFLNACRTAMSVAGDGAYLTAVSDSGLSGFVGTEQETIDCYANRFGLKFLKRFLQGGVSVATVMRDLRREDPLGLLYGTFCPPYLFVSPAAALTPTGSFSTAEPPPALGAPLGPRRPETREDSQGNGRCYPLPRLPYAALASYGRHQRALFAGRRVDCDRFTAILNAPETRILFLQGASGVGKTSFLQAEVIPFLEEESVGYRFLRRRGPGIAPIEPTSNPHTDDDSSIIFVQAGNDLVAELVNALTDFTAEPYLVKRPNGSEKQIDLRQILLERAGCASLGPVLVGALRAQPVLLHEILAGLGAALPFVILLIVDQAEQVFTQRQQPASIEILAEAAARVDGDYKTIISLRTEFYGRMVSALRDGRRRHHGAIREYLLTDVSQDDLLDAIERPTLNSPLPYASDVPAEVYRFSYEPGLAGRIADEVSEYARDSRDSVLPLLQVICAQLYKRVVPPDERGAEGKDRPTQDTVSIKASDLDAIGGVAGGMERHVESLIAAALPHAVDRAALRRLLAGLYSTNPDDGTLTSALVLEESEAKKWRGRIPFREALEKATAPGMRLIRRVELDVKRGDLDGRPTRQTHLSLGHDSLAHVVQAWAERDRQREQSVRQRRRVLVRVVGAIALLLSPMLWLDASRARLLADVRRRLAVAETLVASQPDVALLVALDAQRDAADSHEARSMLLRTLEADPRLVAVISGESKICDVAYSSSGALVAAVGCDGDVRFWEPDTGRERYSPAVWLPGGERRLSLALVDQEHPRLEVAFLSGLLRSYDVATGTQTRTCRFAPIPPDGVDGEAAISPHGRLLAYSDFTSGKDTRSELHIWDVLSCAERLPAPHPPGGSRVLVFSPRGDRLGVAGTDDRVAVLDVESGAVVAHWPPPPSQYRPNRVRTLAFSPEEDRLGASYDSSDVRIYRLDAPADPEVILLSREATLLAIGRAGASTAVVKRAIGIDVWDPAKGGGWAERLLGHTSRVTVLAQSPDGTKVVSAAKSDRSIYIWAPERECRICSPVGEPSSGTVSAAALSPDGNQVLISRGGGEGSRLELWQGDRSERMRVIAPMPPARSVDFAGDGSRALVVSDDNARLIDLSNGALVSEEQLPPLENFRAAPLAAAGRAASILATAKGQQVVLTTRGNEPLFQKFNALIAMRLTHDERLLLAGDRNGMVAFLHPETGASMYPPFVGHIRAHEWKEAVFSLDGTLYVEGQENVIKVWDLRAGKPHGSPLLGHDAPSYVFALTEDNQFLASGDHEGAIHLWDLRTNQAFGTVLRTGAHIKHLQFSQDGRRLLSSGPEGVRLLDLDPASWRALARTLVRRNLSQPEWKDYVGDDRYRRTFPDLPDGPDVR